MVLQLSKVQMQGNQSASTAHFPLAFLPQKGHAYQRGTFVMGSQMFAGIAIWC